MATGVRATLRATSSAHAIIKLGNPVSEKRKMARTTLVLRHEDKVWDLRPKMGKVMVTEKPPCSARVPYRNPSPLKYLSSPPLEMLVHRRRVCVF